MAKRGRETELEDERVVRQRNLYTGDEFFDSLAAQFEEPRVVPTKSGVKLEDIDMAKLVAESQAKVAENKRKLEEQKRKEDEAKHPFVVHVWYHHAPRQVYTLRFATVEELCWHYIYAEISSTMKRNNKLYLSDDYTVAFVDFDEKRKLLKTRSHFPDWVVEMGPLRPFERVANGSYLTLVRVPHQRVSEWTSHGKSEELPSMLDKLNYLALKKDLHEGNERAYEERELAYLKAHPYTASVVQDHWAEYKEARDHAEALVLDAKKEAEFNEDAKKYVKASNKLSDPRSSELDKFEALQEMAKVANTPPPKKTTELRSAFVRREDLDKPKKKCPKNYLCNKCGVKGDHFLKDCPQYFCKECKTTGGGHAPNCSHKTD